MSDWEGYSVQLAEKVSYTNTYYHTEPRFDITRIAESDVGRYDFLISTDVFEHIPVFELDKAFSNAKRVLAPGGFLLLTVPFDNADETREHFPQLHDFRIVEANGGRKLINRTVDGTEEVFDNLIFHGGDGATLEMRKFSECDIRRRLSSAGFNSIRLCKEPVPKWGIDWPTDWDMPIVARQ